VTFTRYVYFSLFILPVLIARKIPYRPKYRRLFSDAFDVYLEIIRVVDARVKAALGHDSPDWRVLNACPACSYEVCTGMHATILYADFCSLRMSLNLYSGGCLLLTAMTR